MTVPTADRGRAAAYAAETFAFSGSWLDSPVPRAEAEAMARSLVSSRLWARLGGPALRFVPARGTTSSCRNGTEIAFTDPVLASTVTHELAHALTVARQPAAAAHGPEWRGWSSFLVEVAFGTEAAVALDQAFAVYDLPVERPPLEWTGAPLIGWPAA